MKSFKIMTALLSIAIILGCTGLKAYSNQDNLGICVNGITHSSWTSVGPYTKDRGGSQSIELYNTYTSLTNPCTSCVMAFKLDGIVASYFPGAGSSIGTETITLTMGNSKYFPYDHSQVPGDWTLKIQRHDFTLLNTTADFTWNINI